MTDRTAGLIPQAGLRTVADGTILIGGSPITILRLSPSGAALVRQWFTGHPVANLAPHQQLAERLVVRNMATRPTPEPRSDHDPVVIVPVKDDRIGLDATLASLASLAVIVVDDGSRAPIDGVSHPSAVIIRHERPRGPGEARNAGLRHPLARSATFIAFVDAGVEIDAADLRVLTGRLVDDDELVLAAPRVRSKANGQGQRTVQERCVAEYERSASPLDLGSTACRIGRGSPVPYVPTACVVIRRTTLDRVGGFDGALRFGEDVDLTWRLLRDGARMDYVASIEATHPPRSTIGEFTRQRIGYGSAAGPLGVRHGDLITPWRANGWSAGIIALLTAGFALPAAAVAIIAGEQLTKQLPSELPDRREHAYRMSFVGHGQTLTALGSAAVRPWLPFTTLAVVFGPARIRRGAVLLTIVGRLAPFLKRNRSPREIPTLAAIALGALDDASYGIGVWKGAIRARTLRPLLPTIARRSESPGTN